jgi:GH43 family beta-xylosidase
MTPVRQPDQEVNGQQKNGFFANPLFDGADPWLIRKDRYYYYCSASGRGISVSRSRFITRKEETKRIWEAPDSGWNRSCIWAPELHFLDGRWYIYYAGGVSGPPYIHQKTGVLRSETDDPMGPYIDMGMLYTGDNPDMKSDNVWAIDMTVFRYRGKLYAVWSGWEKPSLTDKTSQHLYIALMKNPYTMESPRVRLSSPVEAWETGGPLDLQEGPEILEKGNKLFIIYSCRESWTVDYRLGQLEMTDPEGKLTDPSSWKKSGPVFSGPLGTGHCSFVKSPDGKEDWIIFHSKKSAKEGWDREIRAQKFIWNKNGYPAFGTVLPAGTEIKRPSGEMKLEKVPKR